MDRGLILVDQKAHVHVNNDAGVIGEGDLRDLSAEAVDLGEVTGLLEGVKGLDSCVVVDVHQINVGQNRQSIDVFQVIIGHKECTELMILCEGGQGLDLVVGGIKAGHIKKRCQHGDIGNIVVGNVDIR